MGVCVVDFGLVCCRCCVPVHNLVNKMEDSIHSLLLVALNLCADISTSVCGICTTVCEDVQGCCDELLQQCAMNAQ